MHGRPAPLSTESIVRRYYGVWLTYSLAGGFLAGVYPLFLRSRGLNQFEINSVLAVYFAVTFLLDVPTGAFADAIGRRLALVLGSALRCLAFGLYFVSHAYVLFLVAETVDAVGTTFCNGAIDAWGVDALDEAGFQGTKDALFSDSWPPPLSGRMWAASTSRGPGSSAPAASSSAAWSAPFFASAPAARRSAIAGRGVERSGRESARVSGEASVSAPFGC